MRYGLHSRCKVLSRAVYTMIRPSMQEGFLGHCFASTARFAPKFFGGWGGRGKGVPGFALERYHHCRARPRAGICWVLARFFAPVLALPGWHHRDGCVLGDCTFGLHDSPLEKTAMVAVMTATSCPLWAELSNTLLESLV